MIYQPPVQKIEHVLQGPKGGDKLSDALGRDFERQMTMKQMRLKHGNEPIMGKPQAPKGAATHRGNIY